MLIPDVKTLNLVLLIPSKYHIKHRIIAPVKPILDLPKNPPWQNPLWQNPPWQNTPWQNPSATKSPMTKSPRKKKLCDKILQDKFPPDKIPQILWAQKIGNDKIAHDKIPHNKIPATKSGIFPLRILDPHSPLSKVCKTHNMLYIDVVAHALYSYAHKPVESESI